jgi:tetratricopeptide (TPR) repeat protein
LEQYKNAISALQKVIKIKPDEYVSYHDIAYAYFTLKQYKKALKIIAKETAMSIKDAGAFVNDLVRGRGFGNVRSSITNLIFHF